VARAPSRAKVRRCARTDEPGAVPGPVAELTQQCAD
jgi:hypothetical protein